MMPVKLPARGAAALALLTCLVAGGCQGDSGSEPTAFRLRGLEPDALPTAGGAPVRLFGSGFASLGSGTRVLFAGNAGDQVEVLSDGELRCLGPPGYLGTGDLRVADGTRVRWLEDAFSYVAPPGTHDDRGLQPEEAAVGSRAIAALLAHPSLAQVYTVRRENGRDV